MNEGVCASEHERVSVYVFVKIVTIWVHACTCVDVSTVCGCVDNWAAHAHVYAFSPRRDKARKPNKKNVGAWMRGYVGWCGVCTFSGAWAFVSLPVC